MKFVSQNAFELSQLRLSIANESLHRKI